jgi:cytochrome c-type biogenesis protein CcmH/NrfF
MLLLAGAGGLILRLRRRAAESVAPLSQAERARADALLAGRAPAASSSPSSASRESRS